MPRNYSNWTFRDVERFLKRNQFSLNHTRGSHYYFIGSTNGTVRQVCVPHHNSKVLHPKTMKSIIDQSGVGKDTWFDF